MYLQTIILQIIQIRRLYCCKTAKDSLSHIMIKVIMLYQENIPKNFQRLMYGFVSTTTDYTRKLFKPAKISSYNTNKRKKYDHSY